MPEIDYDRLRESLGSGDRQRRVSSVSSAAARARSGRKGGESPFGTIRSPDEAAAESKGGGSIFGNISQGVKDIATGAIPGLAGLGAEAWDSTVGNVGAMVARRVIGDDVDRVRDDFSVLGRAFINENTMEALGDYEEGTGSGGDAVFAATPLPRTIGRSLSDTGGRVTQQAAALAPGGLAAGDTDYVEAYRNNALLPLLVEDVGNAAIVGSTVAKPVAAAARAGAGATGSSRLGSVAAKAGDVADLSRGIDEAIGKAIFHSPITLPNKAVGALTGRSIGERLAAGGRRVASTDRYQAWRESPRVRKVLDETFASPRSRPLGQRLSDDQQTAAFDSDQILEALRDVTDVVGDMPELGIAAMMEVGQVNRLIPSLADLDEATFARLIGPEGALKGLSDAFDEGAIRSGIQIANRYLADPDSLTPEARAKIDAAADIWGGRVLPLMEERFLDQVGRRDEVHPETVALLAGDELLPYEELRVIGDHVARERTLTNRRDKLSEAVGAKESRLGIDEGIFADPIRVLRERAGDIERAMDDLFTAQGWSGVVDLLDSTSGTRRDIDGWGDTPTPAQMDKLRADLRRQIDGRAGALAMGRELPNDPITDMVLDMGLGQVIRPRARSSRAAVRETRAEGARRQAETDTGRLDARVGNLEVKAADLAEILDDALMPKVNVPLGKLRASVRKEGAASKRMQQAAAALTRIKNRLEGDQLKADDLAKDVATFRREARTVLLDMVTEARDRARAARTERLASLSDEWERLANRDTIGVTGPDGWAAVQSGLRRAGYFGDPRDVRIDGRRVFVDATKSGQVFRAADDVAAEANRYQNYADGTEGGFLDSFAADVVAPAVALQVNPVTKSKGVRRRGKRGQDVGDTSLYADAPFDEVLLSDLTPAEMLAELLDDPDMLASVFDDPEMVAALSGDEASAVDALRAMRAERWEGEDFAEAVETGELLRSIDEDAADLAAGDPRSILASDDIPAIGTTGRSAAKDAYDGDLGKAAAAGYDLEAGRRDLDRRARERARAETTAVNRAAEKGARAAKGPATRAGRAEGAATEATREGRLAETRAARGNDAEIATAEGFAEAQGAAFERGAVVGVRKADLDRTRAALARVEAELKDLDEGLLDRLTAAREKVTSAPAKYRIAIQFARDLDTALDEMLETGVDAMTEQTLARIKAEIVTSTVDALDAMDSPGMLFGGRVRGDAPKLQNVRSAAASRSSAEYLKEGVLGPVSPADQALLAVREIQRAAQTETAKWMVSTYGKRADELVPDVFAEGRPMGRDIAAAVNEVAKEPLVPLDIRRWMAERGGNLPEDQIGPDTVFVPEWAVDTFTSATKKIGEGERLMRDWFDRPTTFWKHGVLALSPTWHTGNMVGNMLMTWAGGVNPARQAELMSDALAMVNRARRGEFLPGDAPRRMYGTGQAGENLHMMGMLDESESGTLTRSEMRALGTPAETRRGRARQGLQRAIASDPLETRPSRIGRAVDRTRDSLAQPLRTSYEFNGFIDDLTHAIVYLDRAGKGLDPEVALRDSLRVAGDFSRLSKFERRFVRRALPFYSWMRHITTLTADLAVNHPLRTAWTLHLWTMTVPEDLDTFSDIPAISGSIQSGPNQFLRLANLFPFGAAVDVGEGATTDPLAMLGSSANPIAKLGLEAMTGLEFGPGGLQPLSRPFGSANTDAYGNEKLGPIGWGAFGARATRLLPQTRGLRELARNKEDRVVRYDTGQKVTIDGAQIPDVNRRDAGEILARDILRVPIFPPMEMDVAAIRARRDDKERNR